VGSYRKLPCVLVLIGAMLPCCWTRADDAAPATQPATESADKIKVGIILVNPAHNQSFYTRFIPSSIKNLADPTIELYALTTQQMAQEPQVAELLEKQFDEQHRIDATDAANLHGLNVIAACYVDDLPEEMIAPITDAVENHGCGLLIQRSIGSRTPGFGEQTQKLDGLSSEERVSEKGKRQCKIVADHPLVADLKAAFPDGQLEVDFIHGAKGEMRGTPLIVALDADQANAKDDELIAEAKKGVRFTPLYVAELGKGKIVALQCHTVGKAFRTATNNKFHVHCVQWLAGRAIK
jgi:hypothetical protein